MADTSQARERMVAVQIAGRGVRDGRVLDAMRAVPREVFVPQDIAEFAYEDAPLPIGEDQTISQPYIVAAMIEAAEIEPGSRVLEIGAGSGYAAAVLGQIAGQVFAVERHEALAQAARQRIGELGLGHIDIRTGDGTLGLADEAPFDAIIVSAGAPAAPEALKRQLAPGGILVVPVGDERSQKLCRIIRRTADRFDESELGAVRFVPLIGKQGWAEDGSRSAHDHRPGASRHQGLPEMIADAAQPLPAFDDPGFGAMFDRFADCRVVLLGEASHGTQEFYAARAAITRHLVENHGFTIVAVEADWPDAAAIDRHVRQRPARRDAEPPFQRFPTWMWRNTEVAALVEWLRAHNAALPMASRAGFYGLDLYNMSGSIAAVLAYLDRTDPEAAAVARERYGCLTPWQNDPAAYGRAALSNGFAQCEAAVVQQCRDLLEENITRAGDEDALLDAAQNARLIASAERYYRIMYYGGAESWNLRDTHMFETLRHLLDAKEPDAKAIVWAHNSHIGDARHTDMGAVRGELNIGQLCREEYGPKSKGGAALIGLGTHSGTVAAASDWDGAMEVKKVLPSRRDSYERLCHDTGISRFLLDLAPGPHEALLRRLAEPRLERFIGVIYRPETELMSHYSQAVLPEQFDAYLWFDETQALTPLGPDRHHGTPDTFPFGE